MTCAVCADDGDRYLALMAQAKHKGTWTRPEVIGYLCGVCGKSGPEKARPYEAKGKPSRGGFKRLLIA